MLVERIRLLPLARRRIFDRPVRRLRTLGFKERFGFCDEVGVFGGEVGGFAEFFFEVEELHGGGAAFEADGFPAGVEDDGL